MNRQSRLMIGVGAGVIAGIGYTLSPLTALCVPAIIALAVWAGEGLTGRERRWFVSVLAVAVVARLLIIAALFLSSDGRMPFETFFGDELFFKNRSVWIRNVGLGVPMSPADVIYAFEDVGISSYLYALALVQALVGKVPYGVHVINCACYLSAVLLLFRMVRPLFGGVAALAGMIVLLFTPSLFMWSISALKEPSYTLAAAIELIAAFELTRATTFRGRVLCLVGIVAGAIALESLRRGGSMVAIAGVGGGYFFGYVLPRPRLTLAAVVVVPLVLVGALMVPAVQARALDTARGWAFYHTGHVGSPGYSYRILDGRYYWNGRQLNDLSGTEAAQYVVRSYRSYVAEPVPWRIESRALLAYLPEQMFWYVLLALAPIGIAAGFSRDPMLTALLAAHAFGAVTVVAMTSGNIGTLIRHRGLVMPYLVWLAGLGLYEVVRTALDAAPVSETGESHAHGHS
jgi:hypothetical protein